MEKLTIKLSLELYSKEAIISTIYKYSGEYLIFQEILDNNIILSIKHKTKDTFDLEDFRNKFQIDLIDQQIRYNTSKEFGYIRDLIVEQAFKPINKK